MGRFEGKRVLVTGAGRNTGLAIARRFAVEGATVALNDLSASSVAKAATAVREETGAPIIEAPANLADLEQVEEMFGTIRAQVDGVDILVNNAAHLGIGPNFLEMSMDFFEEVVRVNLLGAARCCQLAARMMVDRGGGSIINLGSNTSDRAIRGRSAYIASKGSMDALTRSLALELAPHDIRVNMVVPGYIRTDRWENISSEQIERRRANIPLGHEASVDEIARPVAFLASEESCPITGARLVVDGGVTVQMVPSDCEE